MNVQLRFMPYGKRVSNYQYRFTWPFSILGFPAFIFQIGRGYGLLVKVMVFQSLLVLKPLSLLLSVCAFLFFLPGIWPISYVYIFLSVDKTRNTSMLKHRFYQKVTGLLLLLTQLTSTVFVYEIGVLLNRGTNDFSVKKQGFLSLCCLPLRVIYKPFKVTWLKQG